MNRTHLRRRHWSRLAFAALVAFGPITTPSGAQCRYDVTSIESAAQADSTVNLTPYAMNDHGWVVGTWTKPGLWERAFLWTPDAGFEFLPMPEGTFISFAVDINNANVIIGYYGVDGDDLGYFGFLIDGDEFTSVYPPIEGDSIRFQGINENNEVAGYWANSFDVPPLACRWFDGVLTDLDFPDDASSQRAYDINDSSKIVGDLTLDTPDWDTRAFLWDDGETTELGLLPDAYDSYATAVNNHAEVVGRCRLPGSDPIDRAFLWRDGVMLDLGTVLGYEESKATDINDRGQVLVDCWDPGPIHTLALWQQNELIAINELHVLGSDLDAFSGKAMNNAGQIAGRGSVPGDSSSVAFVLTPIDVPEGDVDLDCRVGVPDLLYLLEHWGQAGSFADFDGDGLVGVVDLLILLEHWTETDSR